MFEVIKSGLETSVQDYPGRIGGLNQGLPMSGPMDNWSFRLANILVGNKSDEAGLECQFIGPTIKFLKDRVIAITGANMSPKIDGVPIPMWENIYVKANQILELEFAIIGARTYIAFSGGIKTDPFSSSWVRNCKICSSGIPNCSKTFGKYALVTLPKIGKNFAKFLLVFCISSLSLA